MARKQKRRTKRKSKTIFVGDLGKAKISAKGKIPVYYVREFDGTRSWQLNPDMARGDTILKRRMVIPLEY